MAKEDTKIEALDQDQRAIRESLEDIKAWVTEATDKLSGSNWDREQYSRQLDILKTISKFIDQTIAESTYYSVEKNNIASKMQHIVHSERTRIDIGNAICRLIFATLIPVILVIDPFMSSPRLTLPVMIRDLVNPRLRVINSGYSLEKQFSKDNAMSDLKKLKRYAEKLAKARNDDERYQPLKDIMDGMIIMLAKASSMFMPAAVVDITIKALGIIGGHLADIIKEDFEKIVNQPKNSSELTELTKKKEELEISIKNMQSVSKDKENEIMLKLTEQAVMLGLLGRSNYDTTEEFIKQLEGSIKSIQTNDDQGKALKHKAQFKTEGGIELLCKQATENIAAYKALISPIQEIKRELASLKDVLMGTERKERKSIKEMIKETKTKRDTTYKEKIHRKRQQYQDKFKTM